MAATEALVFDAIRTPRGKGKMQRLAAQHQARRPRRRPDARDARPQREARSQPGRRRRPRLRLAGRRPGRRHRQDRGDQGRPAGHGRRRPAQPLLRLRPRGRQHRRPEGRLRLGGPRLRRRRRVDVARADGLRRRRLGDGPRDQLRHLLHPAGHRRRPDRHDRGASAATTSTPTPPARRSAPPAAQAEGRFDELRRSRSRTSTSTSSSTTTSSSAPARPSRRSASLKPSFAAMGEMGGFDAVALQKYHWVEKIDHVHTPGNSSGIVDGASLRGDRQRADRRRARPDAARAHPRHGGLGRRPDDHAHRPRAGLQEGAGEGRHHRRRPRPGRDQRGVRRRRPALRQGHGPRHGEGQRQRRRDRDGPPARRDRRR